MRAATDTANVKLGNVLGVSSVRVTQPKDREVFWHCWQLPAKMNRSDAIKMFDQVIKPSSYTYEKFEYNVMTGTLRTL